MKKNPDPIDVVVGDKVRHLRRAAGLTQQMLANELGVTFQQVQKYETGANRISASRMQEIANFLAVPVAEFFELGKVVSTAEGDVEMEDPVIDFVLTTEGKNLNRAYWKLEPDVRLKIRHLCQALAEADGEPH